MSEEAVEVRESLTELTEASPETKPASEPIGGHAPEEIINKQTSGKPDYVPEKFWNGKDNEVDVENLIKSYTTLEQAYNAKTEDLKQKAESDFHEKRLGSRPEAASDYAAVVPDGYLPEGTEFQADESDPMMKFWRETAHNLGLGQEEFSKGIAAYVDSLVSNAPDQAELEKSLGENGPERLKNVYDWVDGRLGENAIETFSPLLQTSNGVTNLEQVIAMTKDFQQGGATPGSPVQGPPTRESIEQKMKDPRYSDPYKRDPAYVRQIEAEWQQLIPDPEEAVRQNR
jgi:hypothetical protein